ncbi:cellulose binding domain-containing protein [Coraliomargarita sp. W4R53]
MIKLPQYITLLACLICVNRSGAAIALFLPSETWGNGYTETASVEIINNEAEGLKDWMISFDLIAPITNYWDAIQVSAENVNDLWSYTFSAPSYASTIAADTSFTFGFNAAVNSPAVEITNVLVTGNDSEEVPVLSSTDYHLSYEISDQWDTGATVNVIFTNNSELTINDWMIGFEMDSNIIDFWSAKLLSDDYGAQYAFAAESWNQSIAAGETVTFGIQVSEGDPLPQNIRLIQTNGVSIPEPQENAFLVGFLIFGFCLLSRKTKIT